MEHVKLSRNEATLIGFRVLVDSKGNVVTEMRDVPTEALTKVFKGEELEIIRNIVHLTKPKLSTLHQFLEDELDALNHSTI